MFFLLLGAGSWVFALFQWSGSSGKVTLISLSSILVLFFALFPLLIKPWEIIISNKRVILRRKYWASAKFSKVISIPYSLLESTSITPRVKIVPVLISIVLIQNFSFPLLEYAVTQQISVPVLLRLSLFVLSFFVSTGNIETRINDVLWDILQPVIPIVWTVAIFSLVLGFLLFLFGMPRRNEITFRLGSGHEILLQTGLTKELHRLLTAAGRNLRFICQHDSLGWHVPLLDGEFVKCKAKTGLVNRWSQTLGLVSLAFFIPALLHTIQVFVKPTVENMAIFLFQSLTFAFIYLSIRFAKKYTYVTVTNKRLLFRREVPTVSGLWGKRIYVDEEYPLSCIVGFQVSSFSGITLPSIFAIFVLLFSGVFFTFQYGAPIFTITTTIIATVYALIAYRSFTTLRFHTSGGRIQVISYKLPAFMAWISHRLERLPKVYHTLFSNVINEEEIFHILNSLRDVKSPVRGLESHKIAAKMLIDKSDTIRESWEKVGPSPYYKQSITTGFIVSLIFLYLLIRWLFFTNTILLVFIGLLSTVITSLRLLITHYRSLIITDTRVFYIEEVLPSRIARLFGVLPEWYINETRRKEVADFNYRLSISAAGPKEFLSSLKVMIASFVLIFIAYNSHPVVGNSLLLNLFVLIGVSLLLSATITAIRGIFKSIPRYSLIINSRFVSFVLPHAYNLRKLQKVL